MRRVKNKWLRGFLYVTGFFILLIGILFLYLAIVSRVNPPLVKTTAAQVQLQRTEPDSGLYSINNNWFRKSKSGLYEMYVEGDPFERGVINGKLSKELVVAQEDFFNEQICKLVPSQSYRDFLKYFIAWFNRHLEKNISQEY